MVKSATSPSARRKVASLPSSTHGGAKPGGSSRRDQQIAESEQTINVSYKSFEDLPPSRTDWVAVDALTDQEIEAAVQDDPDAAPILGEEFWREAEVVMPEAKTPVSIRLDRDVLDWFKAQGGRYQTRINAVLRSYVEAHKKAG
jgi:uncharacterized protein (DUF4415 family)